MTDKPIMPNWYREKRTNKENASIYQFLRLIGYNINEARRMRYWSIPHIILNIKSKK